MKRLWLTFALGLALMQGMDALPARAASAFAVPAFQQQWVLGESVTTNFWGPLATAMDAKTEAYRDAPSGQRTVQYFDKGRMEWTDPPGRVTNGLLATELIRGRIQFGDTLFVSKPPPNIAIAGDPGNAGPTYATIAGRASGILAPAPNKAGGGITTILSPVGDISDGDVFGTFGSYDAATRHNVAAVFDTYRNRAGLASVGLAISEPFRSTFMVSGLPKIVLVQIFERRVLTYNPANTPAAQVEMGNVGQHYFQWRYPPNAPPIEPPL
jgi:hypothetical protein